jgi:CRP/FNR family transcriptional regulator
MPLTHANEILPLLSSVTYFQGIDEKALQEIVQAAHRNQYDAGQLVLLEGEQAAGLYLVQSGCLKVSKIALDGREQILQFLEAGEAFNAVGVFTGQPNAATVTALEPSRVWLIRREIMKKLLATQPDLAVRVIEDLAGRVSHLISLVEDLSLRSVEARLARLLLENAVKGRIQRQRWATQVEIASRLGTVPDVVSRTMRKLAERGLIEISRQAIHLIDREGLESIAQIET